MEHQSDVGAPFIGGMEGRSPVLVPSHVSCSIRPSTGQHLLFPTSQCCPSICLPYGRLAMHRGAWRSSDVSTFRVIILTDNLGAAWTPVALQSRASTLITCILATHVSAGKHAFSLLTSVGWSAPSDGASTTIHLISPYCPALALNRRKFPEGFSCHHSNPIRYVVSGLRTKYTARTQHAA